MVQPLAEIEEVCMFKDDGSVIYIPRPAAEVVVGNQELGDEIEVCQ